GSWESKTASSGHSGSWTSLVLKIVILVELLARVRNAMSPLLFFTILHGIVINVWAGWNNLNIVPRKTIHCEESHLIKFKAEGIWNYSTMLIRDDLGLLVLGAREAVYALDINEISVSKSKVLWEVTEEKQKECSSKGKHPDIDCRNYVRVLHQMSDGGMYVCGTNAFSPVCDYISYNDGKLKLEGKQEDGRGKCPFDPFQRSSSLMLDEDLYSGTSLNFLGSEPVILRTSPVTLRTVFKSSWLNEPNFIYMDMVPESDDSPEGDDDKIYMFFSESAIEYDFYNKLLVSRVARVCKGDMGGLRTLQRKWSSFLKARLDCSVPEPSLPYVIQDVFHVRHKTWRKSVFYAVFTSQSSSTDRSSAVCAYDMTDITEVFARGKFKTEVSVEMSDVKWVMYNGECINNAARSLGINRTLDLPDKTLQFIRDRPLMEDAVRPITGKPLLLNRGPLLTRLVVDTVTAQDGQDYPVMFVGTGEFSHKPLGQNGSNCHFEANGYVQKAVNYDGEMHIIEEIELFENAEPVDVLRLHQNQKNTKRSINFKYVHFSDLIQSLKDGDANQCPSTGPETKLGILVLGNNIRLPCQPSSNLAQVNWYFAEKPLLYSNEKYTIYKDAILIYNATSSDAGRYTCMSVEHLKGKQFTQTLAIYDLQEQKAPEVMVTIKTTVGKSLDERFTTSSGVHEQEESPSFYKNQSGKSKLIAMQVSLAVLSVLMVCLLFWNFYMGHISPFMCCGRHLIKSTRNLPEMEYINTGNDVMDHKQQMISLYIKTKCDGEAATFHSRPANGDQALDNHVFKYITDESEI
ncbi:hypothetical protein DNTS_026723, partial [Danionella cerebrum]